MSEPYIDLNRTFTEIDSKTEFVNKDSSEIYDFLQYPNHASWESIIETDEISIILGEAGSGKSTEFEYRANKLNQNGSYSFLIELENLIDKSDPSVIHIDFDEKFLEWKDGNKKAYFFLDSIDESKFAKRSDFKKAIYNFKRFIGIDDLERCKIILSSRFSEWHPATDLNLLQALIPEAKKEYKKQNFDGSNLNSLQDLQTIKKEDSTKKESRKKPRIYRLNPLKESQVRLLADHYLVENPDDFINSINSSHAWSLAKRPLDVKGLIYIWKEKGQLGSFKDILDHHIQYGLKETPERRDTDQITLERAIYGIKCLAASVLLTKRQKFYPTESERGSNSTNVILPQSCLPNNWTEKEIKFLLQRRLFDKATFSTIKFHLRSITEYLAAEWFRDRLDSDEDYLSVQDILFKREEDELIIKDSFKPIVAWLAIGDRPWNKKIRQDILKTFPELFLKYGDPSKLPTDYLLNILQALRLKYGDSRRIYADDIVRSLRYIGKVEFVSDFEDWLRNDKISENFKNLLLRIAFHSEMKGLSEVAKDIVSDGKFYPRTRNTAIHYIGRVGDKEDIYSIKEYLISVEDAENSVIAAAIEAFYPNNLTNEELLILLKKTNDVEEHSVGIEFQLQKHIEAIGNSLTTEQLRILMVNLCDLSNKPPHNTYYPYSEKYYWVGDTLFIATKILLQRDDKEWEIIAKAIYHLKTLNRAAKGTRNISLNEIEELESNAELRRLYFWYCYKMFLEANDKEPSLNQIFGGFSGVSKPKIEDIEWLILDSKKPERKEKALQFIKRYWNYFDRPIRKYFHFRKLIGNDKELKETIFLSPGYYFKTTYRKLKYKFGIYNWSHWYQDKKIWLRRKKEYFIGRKIIYQNLRKIYNGQDIQLLFHLASICSTDSGRYSKVDLSKIEEKYSKIIAWAFSRGAKKYWRTFTPRLPQINSNKIQYGTIIGFTGIGLSIEDGELTFSNLSDKEAQQLVCYAVNELNGYPFWLADLAKVKPDSVEKIIEDCIDKDWEILKDQKATITVLSRIRTSGNYLIPLIDKYLYEKLSDSIPSTNAVLRDTLGILFNSTINNKKVIKICENSIQKEINADSVFILSLGILNQLDLGSALKIVQSILNEIKRELLLWYGIWIQLDAEDTISSIQSFFGSLNDEQKKIFIENLCNNLESRASYGYPTIEEPDYLNPEIFQLWFKIVYKYVDPQDDIVRKGAYSPGSRDHAQDFRRRLLDRFIQLHPNAAKKTVDALSNDPNLDQLKDQLSHRRDSTYQVLADQEIWDPEDIPKFMEEHEIVPKSTYDLFTIILKRLDNLKAEIEREEHGLNLNTLKQKLLAGDHESELRKFLTQHLKQTANDKYTVTAEEELNQEVEPDIRIHKESLNPISIEIKWAQRWSGSQLFEKLKTQLVDQYLRAPNCNYGIYLIGFIQEDGYREKWQYPGTNKKIPFSDLIDKLKKEAAILLKEDEELKGLEVIGINFNE